MCATIFEVCQTDPAVRVLLGDPIRFYPFGKAPQQKVYPYAVWRMISGLPNNNLCDSPTDDAYELQVDVYAKSGGVAAQVGKALAVPIETAAYISGWNGESEDVATEVFSFGFDVSWRTYRE